MFEAGLANLIAGTSAITSIIGTSTTRADKSSGIFPVRFAEACTYPALMYSRVATLPIDSLQGMNRLQSVREQFECRGLKYTDARSLADAVRSALIGYSGTLSDGTEVHAITLASDVDLFDDVPLAYRVVIDLDIWFAAPAS